SWPDRVGDFFALDDDWVRPGGGISRTDVVVTLTSAVLALFVLECMRALGSLTEVDASIGQQWLVTALPCLFLLTRRRFPLTSASLATLSYWAVGTWVPLMSSLLSTQLVYLLVLLGGAAWARNRRSMLLVYGLILFAMFLWLVWGFAGGRGVWDRVRGRGPGARPRSRGARPRRPGSRRLRLRGGWRR